VRGGEDQRKVGEENELPEGVERVLRREGVGRGETHLKGGDEFGCAVIEEDREWRVGVGVGKWALERGWWEGGEGTVGGEAYKGMESEEVEMGCTRYEWGVKRGCRLTRR